MYSTFLSRVTQSWFELFELLKPQNIKKYLYITVKSYVQALKALIKGGWFLFLAFFLWCLSIPFLFLGFASMDMDLLRGSKVWATIFTDTQVLNYIFSFSQLSLLFFILMVIYWISYWLYIFVVIGATRASASKKDHYYFFDLIRRFFIYYGALALMLAIIVLSITYFFDYFNLQFLKKIYYVLFLVNSDSLGLALNPMIIFGTLFLMDSTGRHKLAKILTSANKNKLIWYTYPLTALIAIGFHQLYFFLEKIIVFSSLGFWSQAIVINLLLFLGVPLYITMLSNIYLQQIHEHADWYYEKK